MSDLRQPDGASGIKVGRTYLSDMGASPSESAFSTARCRTSMSDLRVSTSGKEKKEQTPLPLAGEGGPQGRERGGVEGMPGCLFYARPSPPPLSRKRERGDKQTARPWSGAVHFHVFSISREAAIFRLPRPFQGRSLRKTRRFPPARIRLLPWGEGQPDTETAVPVGRREAAPVGRAAVGGVVAPTAAAIHAVRA